jgi:hypothetical protein
MLAHSIRCAAFTLYGLLFFHHRCCLQRPDYFEAAGPHTHGIREAFAFTNPLFMPLSRTVNSRVKQVETIVE